MQVSWQAGGQWDDGAAHPVVVIAFSLFLLFDIICILSFLTFLDILVVF